MEQRTVLINYESHELKTLISDCLSEALISLKLFEKPHFEKEKPFLTRKETAALLSISLPTLHTYTMEGKIKSSRIGHLVRYHLHDVYESLSKTKVGGKNA